MSSPQGSVNQAAQALYWTAAKIGDGTSDRMSFFSHSSFLVLFTLCPICTIYVFPSEMGEGTLRKHGRVFEKIAEKLQWDKAHKGGQPSEWSDIGPSVGCIDCSPLSLDPSL